MNLVKVVVEEIMAIRPIVALVVKEDKMEKQQIMALVEIMVLERVLEMEPQFVVQVV